MSAVQVKQLVLAVFADLTHPRCSNGWEEAGNIVTVLKKPFVL
jgi:hypothetical protein